MACPNIPLPACHWLDNMKISMLCFRTLEPVQTVKANLLSKEALFERAWKHKPKNSRRQKAFESTLVKLTQHVAKPPA